MIIVPDFRPLKVVPSAVGVAERLLSRRSVRKKSGVVCGGERGGMNRDGGGQIGSETISSTNGVEHQGARNHVYFIFRTEAARTGAPQRTGTTTSTRPYACRTRFARDTSPRAGRTAPPPAPSLHPQHPPSPHPSSSSAPSYRQKWADWPTHSSPYPAPPPQPHKTPFYTLRPQYAPVTSICMPSSVDVPRSARTSFSDES